MAEIVKMSDDDLDQVSGGAFNYYTNDQGLKKCYVDGIGTFYCSGNAFENVIAYSSDITLSAQQIVDWALANGYFSSNPF